MGAGSVGQGGSGRRSGSMAAVAMAAMGSRGLRIQARRGPIRLFSLGAEGTRVGGSPRWRLREPRASSQPCRRMRSVSRTFGSARRHWRSAACTRCCRLLNTDRRRPAARMSAVAASRRPCWNRSWQRRCRPSAQAGLGCGPIWRESALARRGGRKPGSCFRSPCAVPGR